MKLLLLGTILLVSILAQANSVQGTWVMEEKRGSFIVDVTEVKIYNQKSCSAYSTTFENGEEVSGGKFTCFLKNNFLKVRDGNSGVIILEGSIKNIGEQLVVTKYNNSYNRIEDKTIIYLDKKD